MSRYLKQSTTTNLKLGPFTSVSDGWTPQTGLTPTVRLSKAGGAIANRNSATALAHDADGYYTVELNATDTNTLGRLLALAAGTANNLPVFQEYTVLAANVYDSLIGGGDLLDVSTAQLAGQTVTASGGVTFPAATLASTTNITAAAGCAVSSIGADVITAASISAGAIDAATFAAGALDAAALAADAVAEIADAVWDEARAGHVAAGSFGEGVASVQGNVTGSVASVAGAVGSVTGAVGSVTALGAQAKLDVNAECDTALADYDGPTNAELNARTLLAADYFDPAADAVVNVTTVASVTAVAAGGITASSIATGAIDADSLAADAGTELADAILSRSVSNVEGTAGEHTLCTVVLAMLEHSISGTTLTIKRTDGSTTHATKTLTLNAAADPVTAIA